MKNFRIALFLISLLPSLILAQQPDDTAEINNLIKAAAAAGGGTVQLQPKTYYYRGTLQLNSDTGALNNITIAGDPSGSTRIINGIRITSGSFKTWDELSTNDPWKNRFPTAIRGSMRWVDLSTVIDRTKDVGIGSWPSGRITDTSTSTSSPAQPAVVNLGGQSLRFADENDASFPWRVSNGSLTDPKVATTSVPMNILAGDPEMRCTAFATIDYSAYQVGVQSYNSSNGEVTLATSIFDPTWTPNKFSKKQRFRLWNGPEFLSQPGEMVLDTGRNRIFFLPRTGAETEMTISSPTLTAPNSGVTNSDMINLIGAKNLTIRNLTFESIYSSGISLRYADNVLFDNVDFKGVGHKAIELNSCTNVIINDCCFYDAYRTFITVSDVSSYIDSRNKRASAFARLTPNGITIIASAFFRSGSVFPQSRAILLTNYNVGTTVLGCTFQQNYGVSVGIVGANNTVKNCTFDNCLRDVTDAGVVYGGGSFTQVGNRVENCRFSNILRPLSIPGSVQIDIACVFIDNFGCGWQVVNNTFDTVMIGIKMNGGRFNLFSRNKFRNISTTDPNAYAIRATNRMGGPDLIQQTVNEFIGLISRADFPGFTNGTLGSTNNWATAMSGGGYGFSPRYNDLLTFLNYSGAQPNVPMDGIAAMQQASWSYYCSIYKTYCYRNVGNLFFFNPTDFTPTALNPFKNMEALAEYAGTPFPVRDVKSFLKSDGSDLAVWPNTGGITGILVQDISSQ